MEVIRREDVLPRITSAVPSFEDSLEYTSASEYFTDEVGGLLLYVVFASLVRYIVRLRLEGDSEAVERLFEAIEEMIRQGDQDVLNLAVVGFLEDLQNTNLHSVGSSPSDFVNFLRPWSRWWWDEVDLFWQAKVNPMGSSGRPRPSGMPDPMRRGGTEERRQG